MQWVRLTLHFPSFFSYRIPDYSSQYALSVPLPSPSAIKLGIVATTIRTTGNIVEGENVFYSIRDADVRVLPPKQIVINSVLVRRLKKKKNKSGFEKTFGVREYVFFSDDLKLFVGCKDIDTITKYSSRLRYLGSGDSILYVKQIERVNKPPENAIKAVCGKEFVNTISKDHYLVYPVKDIKETTKFEEINPYLNKKIRRKVFEIKYYLIKAQLKRGKNWKVIEIYH